MNTYLGYFLQIPLRFFKKRPLSILVIFCVLEGVKVSETFKISET